MGCAENTALHFQEEINGGLRPCILSSINEHKIQLELHFMISNNFTILKHSVQYVHMDPIKCFVDVLSTTYVQFT